MRMNILQLLLVSMGVLLLSCNRDASKHQDPRMSLENKWQLVSIMGTALDPDNPGEMLERVTLEIKVAEMEYLGSDGCNNYFGGIMEMEKEKLSFGIAAGTRKMCMDMEVADQFNLKLPLVNFYKIKSQKLLLFDEKHKKLMEFEVLN